MLSDTNRALDLLEGKGWYEQISSKSQRSLVQLASNSTLSVSSSSDQLPRLFYPSIEDVGILRRLETQINLSKVIPIKLHLLCDHKDRSHKVEGQPGRTVKLNAKGGGYEMPIAKLAVSLLWASVSMVGAVPQVDDWIQSLFTVPEMPTLDGKMVHEMMNPGHPHGPISKGQILKGWRKYWKVNPHTQGLKEIFKLDDGSSFWNDFHLHKVVYNTEPGHEERIGWVCDSHFKKGLNQQILHSPTH